MTTTDMDDLLQYYRQMLLIRLAEEQLSTLFADGAVPGFIHLSIGQEAVAVGVTSSLDADDTVASNHRGHGHALAKGLSLHSFYSELFGMQEGLCGGRGGSMHVADLSKGMLGANGIVGAGLSIAVGSALAHKVLGRDSIAVVFFGDGALAEGLVHESFNMAKLKGLPVLFVCENNGWSEFSSTDEQIGFTLESLAAGYEVPYSRAVGNDVLDVAAKAGGAVDQVRQNSTPAVLECKTLRVRGHFEGDPQKYRDRNDEEIDANDPLRIAHAGLLERGCSDQELADIRRETQDQIDQAVATARKGTVPEFGSALAGVYADLDQPL